MVSWVPGSPIDWAAITPVAGQRGADLDFVDAELVDHVDQIFVEHGTGKNDRFLRFRIDQIIDRDAAENALTQRLDHFTAFNQRLDDETVLGAAIIFGNDQILRHIDQTTGQVTGVGGLQRGIGQALTSAVSRDEVLENVQTFAEVGGNRRFDNRAIRLRHQAAHTGQLTNLGR